MTRIFTCVWYFQSVPERHSPFAPPFDTKKSFIERQAIANSKEQTCQVIHTVSNATSVRADTIRRSLNINTKLHPPNSAVGRKSKEISITGNHDRSYPSPKTSENAAVDDEYSWYLHFSVFISHQCLHFPSVSFLTKIIAIYAEQMSPDSSFHFGAGPGEDYEETRRADGAKDLCRSYGGQWRPAIRRRSLFSIKVSAV